jgi:pimeloyl-ACP methyl ester carboxylesterase
LVRARPDRVAGVIWLAPAPDFTQDLGWDLMTEDVQREILEKGQWLYQSESDTYPITRTLIESGREHLVLAQPLKVSYPVRILHGMADLDVPWQRSLKLVETIEGDVRVTFLKNSGHRLSTPSDLKLLEQTLDSVAEDFCA